MAAGDPPRTLRGAVSGVGRVVFAVRGAVLDEPSLGGWAARGEGPDTVDVHHVALSGLDGGEVEVETSMLEWSGRPIIAVRQLLGSDWVGPAIFPLSSTVTKEQLALRVLGRCRRVVLYRCGPRWIVALRAAGRHVTITGRLVDPAALEVVRLTDGEVEVALSAAETRHRDHEGRMRASEVGDA